MSAYEMEAIARHPFDGISVLSMVLLAVVIFIFLKGGTD